ncbi:MAG: NADH:ubiquinone oxidoreductase [Dictyoglomus sp. NZ13-RE01]|nr:MAG: NADH:ubiquinone oxidoreductase [Dictyoglomus sp. NZ13-RE01]
MKEIITYGLILMLICAIAAGALAYTYIQTQKVIAQQKEREKLQALQELLPNAKEFEKVSNLPTPKNKLVKIFDIYIGKNNDKFIGKVFEVSIRGYSSDINLMIGIDSSGKIVKVKVISQQETPGLGANIVKDEFLSQFIGKSSPNLEIKRDIQPVTGATISSRAVLNAVKEVLSLK